jgi:nitroreductase
MNETELHVAPKAVQDAIRCRCSVRAYAGGKLPWTILSALLSAAVRAPTALGAEPWAFAVVQNPALLKAISERARMLLADEPHPELLHRRAGAIPMLAVHDFDVFHGAGTLIVIGSDRKGEFVAADCWLAAENLMLQACAMGLGTCVIGSALSALNLPEVKDEIGLPKNFQAFAAIAAGVPAGAALPAARREPRVLAWA